MKPNRGGIWVTAEELAKLLGLPVSEIEVLTRSCQIACHRSHGEGIFYDPEQVQQQLRRTAEKERQLRRARFVDSVTS